MLKKQKLVKRNTWVLIKQYKFLYLLMLIPIVEMIIFNYAPMYGIIVAFKKFKASQGIWGSDENSKHKLIKCQNIFRQTILNWLSVVLLHPESALIFRSGQYAST